MPTKKQTDSIPQKDNLVERNEETLWIWEDDQMIEKTITFVPLLYQIFDKILISAADRKGVKDILVKIDVADKNISVWNHGDFNYSQIDEVLGFLIDVSIQMGNGNEVSKEVSFVNNIPTMKGGSHVDYITSLITDYLAEIVNLQPNEIKRCLWVFVNAHFDDPTFDSQTKEKLTTNDGSFGSTCKLTPKFLKKIADSLFEDLSKKKSNAGKLNIPKLQDAKLADTPYSQQCTLILTRGYFATDFVLETIESEEGGQYNFDEHIKDFVWDNDEDGDAIELAFSNMKIEERKHWLQAPPKDLDLKEKGILYRDFMNKEFKQYAMADLQRSIPSMVDGLKPQERKILFYALKKPIIQKIKVYQSLDIIMCLITLLIMMFLSYNRFRLHLYEKRKTSLPHELKIALLQNKSKERFARAVRNKELDLEKPKSGKCVELKEKCFKTLPSIKREAREETPPKEEEEDVARELEEERKATDTKLQHLTAATPKSLWLADLAALDAQLALVRKTFSLLIL
ncbi:DNA topoisomerase 2 [Tanacetum coccineum]